MSERIEALVRDAQEAVAAGGAPDLDRIRHALPVLARRRARRRRAGLAVVAAAAVLVAGFAVVTLGDRGPGRTVPAGPPPPDPSTAATAAPGPSARDRDVNLVYELVDPPQHLREKVRTIADTPDGLVITRVWTDRNVGTGLAVAAGQPSLVLTVRPGRELPPGETVDLLGTPGSYTQQAATARLAWTDFTPDPAGRIVQLDAIGLGMSRDSLANLQHRVRRSGVRFDSPLTLGWGPGARARYTSSIGGDDGRSITAIVTADASAEHAGVLTVSLAPRPDVLPQGEAVSVHGRPAELIEDTDPATGRPRQRIVQESSDNQALLTVTFTNPDGPLLSQWDVVRAADSVRSALDFNGEWLTG